ncbi:MAG: hypothetical protein WB996_03215 [Ignavibacteriaceae bacterium]
MEIIIDKKYRLKKLHYWLKYELSTSTLLLLSWLWILAIGLATAAAIIFTPFMLTILFKEKKYGWIIFFVIIVILPAASAIIYFLNSDYLQILALVPLVLFYFYCFLLRITIHEWLS